MPNLNPTASSTASEDEIPEVPAPTSMAFVILSFDHPQLTEKTVRSVLPLADATTKVILIHNGSKSKNVQLLQDLFPLAVEHFVIPENQGFSGGANRGLDVAFKKFKWVFFLTNDCEILSPFTSNFVEHLSSGIYAPLILRRNSDKVDSIGGLLDLRYGRLTHCRTIEEFNLASDHSKCKKSTRIRAYVPGTAFILDQDSWQRSQKFDESLSTYWEDVDLSLRANNLGIRIEALPEIKLRHKIGKTCHHLSLYSLYYFQRNRIWISNRHARSRQNKFEQLILNLCLFIDALRLYLTLKKTKRSAADRRLFRKAIYDGFQPMPAEFSALSPKYGNQASGISAPPK